jgi:hypothetical protein
MGTAFKFPVRIDREKALTGFFHAQHCFAGVRKARNPKPYVS